MTDVVEYGGRRAIVVGAVMLAALLQLADTTIVNVALPTIDGALGASSDEGAWFITAYIIANVIVIPLAPWLQAQLGRRNYFAISIAGFTVTSVLCGLANDTSTEIALRFVQGAFGGGLLVPAQQIIRDSFPPSQLSTSQTLFGFAVTVGPTIGPTLGGILTDDFSWRWIYFINVLPGIIATVLVVLYVRDPEKPRRMALDALGIGLLAVGLGCLQYVLDEGERRDWFGDAGITYCALLAAVLLAAFVVWELYGTKAPAVALRVLKERGAWTVSLTYFFIGVSLYGLLLVLPLYTQGVLGFTTTMSGLLLMLRAGTALVMFPITNWVVQRQLVDLRVLSCFGIIAVAVTSWLQADVFSTGTDFNALVVTTIAGGFGFSWVFVPIMVLFFRAIKPASVPAAIAITRLMQQIGGSVGSALVVTLLARFSAVRQTELASEITLHNAPVASLVQQHGAQALTQLQSIVATEAFNGAAADTMRVLAVLTIFAAVGPFLVPGIARPKRATSTPVPPSLPKLRPIPVITGHTTPREPVVAAR
jgi:DHA2 family multidrug resistance protein